MKKCFFCPMFLISFKRGGAVLAVALLVMSHLYAYASLSEIFY